MNNRQAYSWLTQPGIQTTIHNWDKDTNEAIDRAIEALKKNVPMPYKMEHCPHRCYRDGEGGRIVQVFSYHCPSCGQELGDSNWDGKPDEEWEEYCGSCGQRIDWIHDVELPKFEPVTEVDRILLGTIYAEQ